MCRLYGPDNAFPNGIDAMLVQHLQAAVVLFVTDVMHRVIVWKERQMRLKKRSVAWRPGEQVRRVSITHGKLIAMP